MDGEGLAMKKCRFTEQQIFFALEQAQGGTQVAEEENTGCARWPLI
jgi:hypothetical protein